MQTVMLTFYIFLYLLINKINSNLRTSAVNPTSKNSNS